MTSVGCYVQRRQRCNGWRGRLGPELTDDPFCIGLRSNAPIAASRHSSAVTQGLSVAIVDDEASVRKALGRVLSASHITAKTYESGQQFLDSLAAQKPDCVILDLHMPGMSGHDVQCALKRTVP